MSGIVTFTVSIDQPDAAHPVNDVYFEVYGHDGHRATDISVPRGQCSPTCDVSATFDTKTLIVPTNPDPVQALPDLGDGTALFAATVYTSFGPYAMTSKNVDIDNHRPALVLPDLPIDRTTGDQPVWSGIATMSTRVQSTVDPDGGLSVDSFRLMVPGLPTLADVPIAAPADGTGTGTITVDTSKVPPGPYRGYLVAIDSLGVSSSLMRVLIGVPDPYQISAMVPSATADQAVLTVKPYWLDHSTASETWLTDLTVTSGGVNGAVLAHSSNVSGSHTSASITVPAPAGAPFSPGDNSFTVRSTDNRGIERTVSVVASTTNPITATWTTDTVVAGAPVNLGVSLLNSSQVRIYSVDLAIDGRHASSATAIFPPGPWEQSVPPSTQIDPGRHDVSATVTLTNGQRFVVHHGLVANGRPSVRLTAPRTVRWNDNAVFHTLVTLGRRAQTAAPVTLQSRTAGSTAWVSRASARTNQSGVATLAVPARFARSTLWRIVTPAGGYSLGGGSTPVSVAVSAAFGAASKTAAARPHHATRFAISVQPHERGVRAEIQEQRPGRSSWATVTHATASSSGRLAFTMTFGQRGTYHLRVKWPTTALVTSTLSRPWTQRVTKRR